MRLALLAAFGLGALGAIEASAGVVVYRLGEQDFAGGQGPILVAAAREAGANEAAPFDGTVYGDDRQRRFGKIAFSYSINAPLVPADGLLTLGLIGLDSPPGSPETVRLFLDGVAQPTGLFAGVSPSEYPSSASVVSLPVPAGLLADGRLDVSIRAFRRGPDYPGNAIEADFATLSVTTLDGVPGTPPPIDPNNPLPGGNPGGNPYPWPGEEPIPGGNPNPGEGPGNQPGTGGPGGGPSPAVPLPPAAWLGLAGMAWVWRRSRAMSRRWR